MTVSVLAPVVVVKVGRSTRAAVADGVVPLSEKPRKRRMPAATVFSSDWESKTTSKVRGESTVAAPSGSSKTYALTPSRFWLVRPRST